MIQLALPQRGGRRHDESRPSDRNRGRLDWASVYPGRRVSWASLPVPGTYGSRSHLLVTCLNLMAYSRLLPAGKRRMGEEIMMAGRLCVPVDAYMLLERDDKVLMLRRSARASYAAGLLCPTGVRAGSPAVAC